eukprot:CAMPEP_0174887766 /NCGR_PEP_ID=MMETSP0167-20121228/2995_1 /TAXON_ID=38298 /ORGANISM="Rhodella maculata, Strain CCMP736" /LENGTH=55 /DNA_ID=CAMNT_0016124395 /DNA_START=185 /DNA_END=349 /DNA_ORIENTATION=-
MNCHNSAISPLSHRPKTPAGLHFHDFANAIDSRIDSANAIASRYPPQGPEVITKK